MTEFATLIEDQNSPGQFRVEFIDNDGGCEVAAFSGPNARLRAICFAGGGQYYDGWNDPEDWGHEQHAALAAPIGGE